MNALTNEFGKVAVLMGGWSAEREISLLSGNAVLAALQSQGVDAHGIDVDHNIAKVLIDGNFDRAFIVLHGRGGEDGTMQGMLSAMSIPFTGSNVQGSSLAMDKLRTKQIWSAMNLPTPDYWILESEADCAAAIAEGGLPLIVKPVLEGSSIGMSKVEKEEELIPAWQKAKECGGTVIAERWIHGVEYTAAILNDKVLPMIRLETSHTFYDYEAKYQAEDTKYICPCGLDNDDEKHLQVMVRKAFDAVGASGWGRVDFMIDQKKQPWLIEVNTVPGMTDHSLVPMAAKQAGIDFQQLVIEILKEARYES
ncbi:MAG: D-alanine--D-alanine ligase [Gammaproteobacteria bacterium]|nr:D-alanine--D-alanine ligase [Gammaproteobacteria bacterium]